MYTYLVISYVEGIGGTSKVSATCRVFWKQLTIACRQCGQGLTLVFFKLLITVFSQSNQQALFSTNVHYKGLNTCYSAAYMSHDQQLAYTPSPQSAALYNLGSGS